MKRLLAVLCVGLISACAHSPVQIRLQPQVQVQPDTLGSGYSVSVRGENRLPGGSLGSLGGIYADSANVTLATSVEQALGEAVARGFESWSFRPVDGAGDVQVVASLTQLSYDSPNSLVTTKVDSSATVQLVIRVGRATYTGNYSSSGSDRNLIKPAKEEVESRVNGLLSAALQRAFADEQLKSFLRANL